MKAEMVSGGAVMPCARCGTSVFIPLPGPPGAQVFFAPVRCGACLTQEAAERERRRLDEAREFYTEHILDKVPPAYRQYMEACEDVLLAAIAQAWEDAA